MPESGKVKINFNVDLVGLDALYNRIIEELYESVSSGINRINKHDRERLLKFISAFRFKLDYLVKQEELDQSKTHPIPRPFRANAVHELVENEFINELMTKFILARDNMRRSPSSRVASGIEPDDAKRQYSYVKDIEEYLKAYVQQAAPLDFIESSPMRPMTVEGKIFEPGGA
jgi:hypothetical protein